MKITITELPLAAALQVLGFVPNLEKTDNNKYLFIYPKTPEIETAISNYWANELKISPKLHWNNVRELKSRIISLQTNSQDNSKNSGLSAYRMT